MLEGNAESQISQIAQLVQKSGHVIEASIPFLDKNVSASWESVPQGLSKQSFAESSRHRGKSSQERLSNKRETGARMADVRLTCCER